MLQYNKNNVYVFLFINQNLNGFPPTVLDIIGHVGFVTEMTVILRLEGNVPSLPLITKVVVEIFPSVIYALLFCRRSASRTRVQF